VSPPSWQALRNSRNQIGGPQPWACARPFVSLGRLPIATVSSDRCVPRGFRKIFNHVRIRRRPPVLAAESLRAGTGGGEWSRTPCRDSICSPTRSISRLVSRARWSSLSGYRRLLPPWRTESPDFPPCGRVSFSTSPARRCAGPRGSIC